jgi:hypothetical protein
MGSWNFHNDNDELEGNGALNIHLHLLVMAYLQACEVSMGLTPKEQDWVVHKAKQFRWDGNSLLWVWTNGQVRIVPHQE